MILLLCIPGGFDMEMGKCDDDAMTNHDAHADLMGMSPREAMGQVIEDTVEGFLELISSDNDLILDRIDHLAIRLGYDPTSSDDNDLLGYQETLSAVIDQARRELALRLLKDAIEQDRDDAEENLP